MLALIQDNQNYLADLGQSAISCLAISYTLTQKPVLTRLGIDLLPLFDELLYLLVTEL